MERENEFQAIDTVFADFIMRRSGGMAPDSLLLGAMLAVRAVRNSESCADLSAAAGKRFQVAGRIMEMPDIDTVVREYSAPECRCVLAVLDGTGDIPPVPLIMDSGYRLYLQRYMIFEKTVAEELLARTESVLDIPDMAPGELAGLSDFFAAKAGQPQPDCQQLAVFAALSTPFMVISGGPGTGKTTVVAALLALELTRNGALRVMLCAPTGKAQARLQESLVSGVKKLNVSPDMQSRISEMPCTTIHSMLKPRLGSNEFYYNRTNPLPCDLLIVDECSMVSLPLMARMLSALRPETRIVMLGDKDQLASVEAGSVMSDICISGTCNAFAPEVADGFFRQTGWQTETADGRLPLDGYIAGLTENHRFASAPSIGEISDRIRGLQTAAECDALGDEIASWNKADFVTRNPGAENLTGFLERIVRRRIYDGYSVADLPELAKLGGRENLKRAFRLLSGFKVLAAARHGRFGVDSLNVEIRRILRLENTYEPGVPLMVTANDWSRELFNGDIGLVWRMEPDAPVKVYFPDRHTGFLPSELPAHETVFAMTVHKSQGSGFANVLLVLPERESPVLTRELFYTAVTRAESYAEVWGSADIIKYALRSKTVRASGLSARLNLFKREL